MKFHSYEKVIRARKLRRKGLSSSSIARLLGVSSSAVMRWSNDIPSKNYYHQHQILKYKEFQKNGAEVLKDVKINRNLAKIFCALLYWCEGTRHPKNNLVSFSNSDKSLIITFLKLFRIAFRPDENKFRVHLQIHTTHDKNRTTRMWSKLLKISEIQFYPPTITRATQRMKRLNYQGTCSIRYHDFSIFHYIKGVYEFFPIFIDKSANKK